MVGGFSSKDCSSPFLRMPSCAVHRLGLKPLWTHGAWLLPMAKEVGMGCTDLLTGALEEVKVASYSDRDETGRTGARHAAPQEGVVEKDLLF